LPATTLFCAPFLTIFNSAGDPVVGAHVTIFAAGTSTPQNVYTDAALGTPWLQPITTDAAGQSTGPIYVSPTPSLKIMVVDSLGAPVPGYPCDNWTPPSIT